ncbi:MULTISPECIES: hypothetical protein [Roseivirga]|uniref:DUF5056 domain-containing protein n=1 Tax=Roseivirga thermotolerans TaxID=1758176 RepID=A0ABQ3I3H4_9BACT|nr:MULTISPECIES: hypothetical protein [Roseivirga]GHE52739.1 hypothetical protein GCM10011340_03870 [Roseivirga thermotolerans]|tara:strand:+ start:37236 stop:37619 length:384 start_codon:yes stop_codon:yes gene_type:complete
MSKFELSDEQLKQLLRSEGLEEPSLSFNRKVLEQVQVYERARSIRTPMWVKVLFALFIVVPVVLIITVGGVNYQLGEGSFSFNTIQLPRINIDLNYLYYFALLVAALWLSVVFYKILDKSNHRVKNG